MQDEALRPCPKISEADELLVKLGLDPARFRTEGGLLNVGKIRAAILNPDAYKGLYLTEDACKRCGSEAWEKVSSTGGLMDRCKVCMNMRWHRVQRTDREG